MSQRESRTVKLKTPIEAHGKTYTELIIYKPRVKELRQAAGAVDEQDRALRVIAACAQIPISAFDTLELEDAMACVNALSELAPELLPPQEPAETDESPPA